LSQICLDNRIRFSLENYHDHCVYDHQISKGGGDLKVFLDFPIIFNWWGHAKRVKNIFFLFLWLGV